MKPSGSATATVSTATTSQRSIPANGCRRPRGNAPMGPSSAASGAASRGPVALVKSMSVPLRRKSRISAGVQRKSRDVRAWRRERMRLYVRRDGLALDRLLPLLEEFKALRLVEINQQARADRNRLQRIAELLREAGHRRFAFHVGANREQTRLIREQGLAALRQQIVDPQLRGVRA